MKQMKYQNCPNCGSPEIYRRHPHGLELLCARCNYRWQVKQVLAPYLQHKFWLSKPLKGWHHVEVWRSPNDPRKFAYRRAYGASLFGELQGEFDTAASAMSAGTEDAKGLLFEPPPAASNEFDRLKQVARDCYVTRRRSSASDAEDNQIYQAYLLELERIERLELIFKIRECER